VYVKGELNTVADTLSQTSFGTEDHMSTYSSTICKPVSLVSSEGADVLMCAWILTDPVTLPVPGLVIATMLSITADKDLLASIHDNYAIDPWCKCLLKAKFLLHGVHESNGLLYAGTRLIIPRVSKVCELLYHLAHDVLGHFGFTKTYGSLCDSFYWPNMRWDLEHAYILACADCQQNKGTTQKSMGPLHPLLVPDQQGDSVAMDFIGLLPEDKGNNCIVTFTDCLNSDICIIPTRTDISAEDLAVLFFDHWYCENGLPLEIMSDQDKLFMSKFWQCLHKLTGVKLKMLTSYHPESDGASE
jgi:hypothetical protein